jgi:polysaccharide biosynthesis protein PelA
MFRVVSVRPCVGSVGSRVEKVLSSIVINAVICAFALLLPGRAAAGPTTAFHYGTDLPVRSLAAFDRVVVDPERATAAELQALQGAGVEVFAHLDVGEVPGHRPWLAKLESSWKLGEPTVRGAAIMDPAQPGWRGFLLGQARALHALGYRGLLLGGLDRYEAALPSADERRRRAEALLAWLPELARALPRCKFLFQGGLALFPRAEAFSSGLVVGPLFGRRELATHRFAEVPAAERDRLVGQLRALTVKRDLPIVVVDQVPADEREQARQVAARIAKLGFSPWVAPPELDRLGVGPIEVVPRRALVVYDSAEANLHNSPAHRLLALPLEYFGFAVDYVDASGPLLPGRLEDTYAAIVTLLTDDTLPAPHLYRAWLLRHLDAGVKVVIVGRPGFALDATMLARLDLQLVGTGTLDGTVQISRRDAAIGFEVQPVATGRDLMALRARPGAPGMTVHLELLDQEGSSAHAVLSTPWGGLALDPFVIEPGLEGRNRWILEPFVFLAQALALPPIPMLDVSTENGRRIFTSHIDGDGFLNISEMPQRKLASEVILEDILLRYPVPRTVSVIEGEVGAKGLYPDMSPKLEAIARQMFRLPFIEAASHAYSHPFDWDAAEYHQAASHHDLAHLPIPGYVFSLEREIAGSVAYIDQRLLPPGKRTRVFLWSGSAQPSAKAVALTRRIGLFNVNGASVGTAGHGVPSMANVTCLGIPLDGAYQVYAPHPNENNFTNLWHGPFYGYRRAIDVFVLTETPRRIKPISLYYHFYSGAKPGGVSALRTLYEWSLAQEIIPLYLSDYARKVEEFQRATLARTLDGGWELKRIQGLRTVRFDERLGWPDLEGDSPIATVRGVPQGRYASLLPGSQGGRIRFRPERPAVPHVVWTNGQVTLQQRSSRGLKLRLASEVPLQVAVAGCPQGGPRVTASQKARVETRADTVELAFSGKESGDVVVTCP